MCLVLKEVYVSGAHDIGPALRTLFDLILTSHQQSFSYVGTGIPGLNRY